jgi:hypothetical protein
MAIYACWNDGLGRVIVKLNVTACTDEGVFFVEANSYQEAEANWEKIKPSLGKETPYQEAFRRMCAFDMTKETDDPSAARNDYESMETVMADFRKRGLPVSAVESAAADMGLAFD